MNHIAGRIARRRKELGMTQRELAEKLNVSDKTLSRWETGKQIPDAMTIRDIAGTLNMTVSEIYGVEEEDISCQQGEAREESAPKRIISNRIIKTAAVGIMVIALIIAFIICAANYNLKSEVFCEIKDVPIYELTQYDHSVLDWIKQCDTSGKEIHSVSSLRYDNETGKDIASYLFYLPNGYRDTEVDVRYQLGLNGKTLKLYFENMTETSDDNYCLCYVELVFDKETLQIQTYLDGERVNFAEGVGASSFVELCGVIFDVE